MIEVELAGHDCMIGERGAFPQALLVELGTCALEADAPRVAWIAIERHRSAINHAILLSPAAMRFADVDLQVWVEISPLTELLTDKTKPPHVLRRTSMLRDVHAKAVVDQNAGQVGMTIEEESVRDEQSFGVWERLSCKLDD